MRRAKAAELCTRACAKQDGPPPQADRSCSKLKPNLNRRTTDTTLALSRPCPPRSSSRSSFPPVIPPTTFCAPTGLCWPVCAAQANSSPPSCRWSYSSPAFCVTSLSSPPRRETSCTKPKSKTSTGKQPPSRMSTPNVVTKFDNSSSDSDDDSEDSDPDTYEREPVLYYRVPIILAETRMTAMLRAGSIGLYDQFVAAGLYELDHGGLGPSSRSWSVVRLMKGVIDSGSLPLVEVCITHMTANTHVAVPLASAQRVGLFHPRPQCLFSVIPGSSCF
ncbi:uncharacterized protein EV422DRAFT_549153 [Fimicolochytrium jonesii]|uniref:uncharacterized protein n=1 Tax=Fimicolochytrium jonesii TaxID=1396493 RepID=UPI0022FE9E4C|nr:uncharacterized protein EV422DRAFT_549153 [Fimicolochytrium jonesii]KAI8815538.1 hypothetical protein EV422DRAFT_549153 [Fimicolochytrium jonesii]